MPGQARHGVTGTAPYHNHHSCESLPLCAFEQGQNPVIPITIPAKAGIHGCRVKPGMVTGTAPYHNHHSCESLPLCAFEQGQNPVIPITIPAKAGIHGCRVKPGMVTGTAPYHNHHSCESLPLCAFEQGQNPGNTWGRAHYHSCAFEAGIQESMDAGSSPAW